jgi:hypothetical protein
LLVHQLGQLIPVVRKAKTCLDILVLLANEFTVDFQGFVVRQKFAELIFSDFLIRYQRQSEIFVFVVVAKSDHDLGLPSFHLIDFSTLLESLNLANDILLCVEDSHEGPFDTLLVVRVLEPFADVSAAEADLLELGKLHGLQ